MPPPHSAGILLFRRGDGETQVLLIKPGGPFWRNKDAGAWMIPKGMVEPGSDIVMLTYEAHATRENGEPYAALVSTGYVHRADGWKMMFHSQTPIEAAEQAQG